MKIQNSVPETRTAESLTQDSVNVSRRRFLAHLGGLTALGMLSPSLLVPRNALAADASGAASSQLGILTGSHWGAIRATVENGILSPPSRLKKTSILRI